MKQSAVQNVEEIYSLALCIRCRMVHSPHEPAIHLTLPTPRKVK